LEPTLFSKKENAFAIKALGVMKSSSDFKDIKMECRLCYNSRTKQFILRVPEEKEIVRYKVNKQVRPEVCALDPGENVFQTVYTPTNNNCYKICSRDTNRQIYDIHDKIDNVKKGRNHKKYLNRIREKLSNKIKDMHYKTANFLCKNFEVILVGNLSTKSITSKRNNLPKTVKRSILSMAHYAFRERLKSKCEEYDVFMDVVDESYTSKTCGGCGNLHETLGSNRSFDCNICCFKCDRDINAARNILIKFLN
jgi:IS605 OrfB family transposase